MKSAFMHVLAVLPALGWLARATPVGSIRSVDESAGNDTVAIAKRMENAISEQGLRPYERTGRLLLVDMMLGDVAAYSALETAFEGQGDPLNRQWQRNARIHTRYRTAEWSVEDTTRMSGMEGLDSYFDCMPIGDGTPSIKWQKRRNPTKGMFPDGPNLRIKMTQDKRFKRDRADGAVVFEDPTDAVFENVFNVVDGIIVVEQSTSPQQQLIAQNRLSSTQDLPRMNTWSDVAWQMWINTRGQKADRLLPVTPELSPFKRIPPHLSQADISASRSFINAIIHKAMSTQDTSSIITKCLAAGHWDKLPTYGDLGNHDLVPEFDIGHWCYYALLASNEGRDVVDFIAQHRDDLGHKIVSSVQIFATDPGQSIDSAYPTVSFLIDDVADPKVMTRLRQNEALWLPPMLQNRHLSMATQPNLRWENGRANWATRPNEPHYQYTRYWGRW